MNGAKIDEQPPAEVGLAKEHVSKLIGKPYAHPQQRRKYEAERRHFAILVLRRLAELEDEIDALPLVREAENLLRWLKREEARLLATDAKENGGH